MDVGRWSARDNILPELWRKIGGDAMKKLAITGMLLSGLTALAGITGLVICDGESVEAAQEQRMVRVEHTAYGDILCDNRTGVVYFAYGLKSCRILKRFISTDTRWGE